MSSQSPSENKMGIMPIGRLLANMALPMVISMLVQALYNVVDSVYVAQVSQDALTAVSLSFPIQNLMIGFSTGVGVGVNSLLSKCLGSRDYDRGHRTAGNGVILALLCCMLFMAIGGFGANAFFRVQTDIPDVISGGTQYLTIVTVFSFGIFGEILFERLLQATGRTLCTMYTQGTGAILNILLDPVFIFGKFGIPAMGVAGAAVATVIGQIVAFILAVIFHFSINREVRLTPAALQPRLNIIKPILSVGIPSIIMVAIGSFMTFAMNQILGSLSPNGTAVAVFGSYFKLQSFIFMPIFGLNNAMISIVAFNYGARKPDRIKKTIRLACIVAESFMVLGLLLFQLAPDLLLDLFEPSDEFLHMGRTALGTISFSFLVAGFCIVLGAVFQAMGTGIYSTIVSVARQLVVLVPAAYLLSLTGSVAAVWWAFPIAEVASGTVTLLLFRRIYLKKIKPLEN